MRKRSCRNGLLRMLALVCALSSTALAQSERGAITGEVRDPTGAIIPGASVTLTSVDTHSTSKATSNESGGFTFPNLSVGQFTLHVEKAGFRPSIINNITVNA